MLDALNFKQCVKLVHLFVVTMATESSPPDTTHRLDVLGFYCPVPVAKTKQTLLELSDGDVLEVLADDPETLHDMLLLLNRSRHHLLNITQKSGEISFKIEVVK